MTFEELDQQEAILKPLSVYDEYAKRLKAEAESLAFTTELKCGHEIDDSVLDELQNILCNAAEEIRTALEEKLSEISGEFEESRLEAYGLR